MEGSQPRRKFDQEFKVGAVELLLNSGRKVSEVAAELGVPANRLSTWKQLYLRDKEQAFPGKGHLSPQEAEVKRLQKELARTQRERDILKKALAIFSITPDQNTSL
jgi:transposase